MVHEKTKFPCLSAVFDATCVVTNNSLHSLSTKTAVAKMSFTLQDTSTLVSVFSHSKSVVPESYGNMLLLTNCEVHTAEYLDRSFKVRTE